MQMWKYFYLVAMMVCQIASAQLMGDKVLQARLVSSYDEVTPGMSFKVVVMVDILPGLHINSNQPNEEYLIPTVVAFEPQPYFSIGEIVYPQPVMRKFSFSDKKLSVYEDSIRIYAEIQAVPHLEPGEYALKGTLTYQGCDDNSCYAPDKASFSTTIKIVPVGTDVQQKNSKLFPTDQTVNQGTSLSSEEERAKRILEHGMVYALFAFFMVGLALNLTPCVYPVIPLTVSYFGGRSDQSRGSNFIRALFYLFGIALSFALLGILSASAGKQWGFLFQSPWFVVAISTIILLMAASMFGAFEITVPSFLLTKLGRTREGLVGAFVMGLTVGVIIAPCAAGIIIGLVGLVAKMGMVIKGGILFFVMGLGLGLPYLILATFSGLLHRLPQSGMWMIWIKKLFGFLLIAVAIYFLVPHIERIADKLYLLLGLLGIVGGLLLGFLDHSGEFTKAFKRFRWIVGILLIILGIRWTHFAIQAQPTELPWIKYSGQSVEELTAKGKPIFIDFYADWCAPCKQLERQTFNDAKVVAAFSEFTLVKVDCTKPDANTRAFMTKFNVSGMPTLIFLTPQGEEIKELREIGFVSADKFLNSLHTAAKYE